MITKEFVLFDIPAADLQAAIDYMVNRAFEQGRVTSVAQVVQAVLKREEEGTTGFGKGIAIPHGKTSAVTEPTLMFGKLRQALDWKAMDDAPVSMIFLILVPETSHSEHLQILAKLARKLMHDEFVETLQSISDGDELTRFMQAELA